MHSDTLRPATLRVAPALLAGDVDAPALIGGDRTVRYGELRALVDERVAWLGLTERSLVVLSGEPSIEFVVTYLALLQDGHVPLLASRCPARTVDAWQPAAVVSVDGENATIDRRSGATNRTQHDLHPDLALLLSTSGSTGSPKLVRLSHDNVVSNARAITELLALTPADRAITSLPLHYSYGLSVLHSHLAAGASVVVSRASVVDPCFRDALVRHGVTNVAGVPHTYDLIERAGAGLLATPTLRRLTVAGGRMHPDDVVRWADRTAAWGVDFVVMYGQTEATARIAYLPPHLAATHPRSIGHAIPGGELDLAPVSDCDAGVAELVYRGPNVMMGYAEVSGDLARGRELDELRTGDLARRDPSTGLFEIVGRRSRFVKPYGLRIDLDALERDARHELRIDPIAITGDDDLIAAVAPGADRAVVERWIVERTGLPAASVAVDVTRDVALTPSGKPDHATILAAAERPVVRPRDDETERSVASVFELVLGRSAGPGDTFVSLGGDSLAYIESSIRLEQSLGVLPPDWHLRTVAELDARRTTAPGKHAGWVRHVARIDSTVLLRAIGICTIVATHMRVTYYPGGAHLLLAIAGYNLSRFLVPVEGTRERWRAAARTLSRTAGPVVAWTGAGMALFGAYSVGTLLLVNNYVGPEHHDGDHWHFWFIEVFAHLVVLSTAVLSVGPIRRLERRRPYEFAIGLLLVALVFRYGVIEILGNTQLRFRTHSTAFFFVLGWLVHCSRSRRQRLLTSILVAATIVGYFGRPQREEFITVCLVALVWCREVPVPRFVVVPVALVSSASLWILITHFTLWPPLVDLVGRPAAYPLVVGSGVAVWCVARLAAEMLRRVRADPPRVGRKVERGVRIA